MSGTVTRILGIDPGSRVTGYGVVESEGQTLRHVTSGCIRTGDGGFPERLRDIFESMRGIVGTHLPDEIAIERAFVHKNADSALKLGQARAAALCGTFNGSGTLYEYTPKEVKLAVVGKGAAGKDQVQHMVRVLLGLRGPLQADTADALAVAICHAHSRVLRTRLAKSAGGSRT